jgi:hypothetical protein
MFVRVFVHACVQGMVELQDELTDIEAIFDVSFPSGVLPFFSP